MNGRRLGVALNRPAGVPEDPHVLRRERASELLDDRREYLSPIGRHARQAREATGLDPITLHEARHSAATLGSYAGIGDLELTHIMGHSSVTVTKDIYGHMREEQIEVVGQALDSYLEGASG